MIKDDWPFWFLFGHNLHKGDIYTYLRSPSGDDGYYFTPICFLLHEGELVQPIYTILRESMWRSFWIFLIRPVASCWEIRYRSEKLPILYTYPRNPLIGHDGCFHSNLFLYRTELTRRRHLQGFYIARLGLFTTFIGTSFNVLRTPENKNEAFSSWSVYRNGPASTFNDFCLISRCTSVAIYVSKLIVTFSCLEQGGICND